VSACMRGVHERGAVFVVVCMYLCLRA
jgi:hypothetical protein